MMNMVRVMMPINHFLLKLPLNHNRIHPRHRLHLRIIIVIVHAFQSQDLRAITIPGSAAIIQLQPGIVMVVGAGLCLALGRGGVGAA